MSFILQHMPNMRGGRLGNYEQIGALGGTSDEISALQTVLKRYGYYTGPVDGVVGPKTFAGQIALTRGALADLNHVASFLDDYTRDSVKTFATVTGPKLVNEAETSNDGTKLAQVQRGTKNLLAYTMNEIQNKGILPQRLKDFWNIVIVQSAADAANVAAGAGRTVMNVLDLAEKGSRAAADNPFATLLTVLGVGLGIGGLIYLWKS